MSPTCTNSHYDNHATFVPSINHNKDVALLSYVELYIHVYRLGSSQFPLFTLEVFIYSLGLCVSDSTTLNNE